MKKHLRLVLLLGGLLSILAGIYMLVKPASSLASLTLFFALVLLINGIAETVQFILGKNARDGIILLNGIITVLLAVCLLSSTWIGLVAFIPYMLAFWVLVSGFTKVLFSFFVRKESKESANYLLIVGILGIIAGIFLCSNPLFTGLLLAYMIGFTFIYQGVANFILFYRLGKL